MGVRFGGISGEGVIYCRFRAAQPSHMIPAPHVTLPNHHLLPFTYGMYVLAMTS